jgi:cell fate regulator YaaT (PSP1 superfamily)
MSEQFVQVRLREGRKPKRFLLPDDIDVTPGCWVIVRLDEDEDLGSVVGRSLPVPEEWADAELPTVKEIPSEEEIRKTLDQRQDRETDAIKRAYQKVRDHNLDMKLVTAFYLHRSNKMKFFFSSENRVDFRELVKELAHIFHARIEMRQIGVRDAAGMVGGYGLCGQELCCSRFLKGFDPITIKMAKDQNLALNPAKISGCCGRLLCCLKYEHQTYVEAQRYYPRLGSVGRFGNRMLKVVSYNILKETVGLQSESQIQEIPLEEFKNLNPDWRNAPRYNHSMAGAVADVPDDPLVPALKGEETLTAESTVEESLESPEDLEPSTEGPDTPPGNQPPRRRRRNRRRKPEGPRSSDGS